MRKVSVSLLECLKVREVIALDLKCCHLSPYFKQVWFFTLWWALPDLHNLHKFSSDDPDCPAITLLSFIYALNSPKQSKLGGQLIDVTFFIG